MHATMVMYNPHLVTKAITEYVSHKAKWQGNGPLLKIRRYIYIYYI